MDVTAYHPRCAGIAAKVLKSMGVTLKDARVEVEKIIGRGSGFVAVEIPFTPRAKRVLELSLEEARALGAQRRTQAGCLGSAVQTGAWRAHWEAGSEHRPQLCRSTGCLRKLEALAPTCCQFQKTSTLLSKQGLAG